MEQKQNWLERPIHPALPAITNEILIFAAVILLAIVSRFYDLGARVMSHDESLHTYFSWLLYRGQGYQHTPMMHGPFQFHFLALVYFLFGVSDYTARIPAALFGVATVWMVWYWRRYLGKTGSLIAGLLLVISPYMLYYSRYVRNESFVAFAGVLMLYAILRYLETGATKYLYLFTGALLLHFIFKETAYIYAAQALLYLAIYFIAQITRRPWEDHPSDYRGFVIALAIGILALGFAAGVGLYARGSGTLSATETMAPANPGGIPSPLVPTAAAPVSPAMILALIALVAIGAASYFLVRGYGWERIRGERSFDLVMVGGTFVLPLLTAFLIDFTKPWLNVTIPTDAPSVQALTTHDITIIAFFLALTFGLSIALGLFWKRDLWWKLALTFWAPFIILYTTFFTNSDGFFTGTIGSLGYWIVQQGVQRGSQPWYYYLLIQVPVYEFLPALGLILAVIVGLRYYRTTSATPGDAREYVKCAHCQAVTPADASVCIACGAPLDEAEPVPPPAKAESAHGDPNFANTFSLLIWWSITSIVAYSIAGERMPWLTVHITWPMILISGWALGRLVDTTDWARLRQRRALLALGLVIVFVASLSNALISWTMNPPFMGKDLAQLEATSAFLLPAIVAILSAIGLVYMLRDWTGSDVRRVFALTFFSFLVVLTARAAFRAAYINYDDATEYLVYAHGATGIKQIMAQAQEISQRTAGGLNVAIAYDASAPDTGVSWPFVWYLRDYTNQRSFDAPTHALRDSVLVIVDSKNFDKIDAALGPNYYRIDYIRMWWPNQDYFNLVTPRDPNQPFADNYSCQGVLGILRLFKSQDFSRICNAISDPQIRAGILDIWLNRSYTAYAQAIAPYARQTDPNFDPATYTLEKWQPADDMRLYMRKDGAAQIWNYGVGPTTTQVTVDPTEKKTITLSADLVIGAARVQPGGLNAPHSLAFAPDGSFYVADSLNHRILHLDSTGQVIGSWGSASPGCPYPGNPPDNSPPGTFCEPWGVAVGPDGSVYVTDTWNHRVQKFTASGQAIKQWGHFGQGDTPDSLYGPRGIAVDSQGRVFVADTGNKRIVVFDADGNPITQFGGGGLDPGQFDEPVGVAVDAEGRVYVADTWNQRVQTLVPSSDGLSYVPERQWDVPGWNGQGLDNKPFIAVDAQGNVYITDPEAYRVMQFSSAGDLLRVWGDYGDTPETFGLTSGIAVDPQGHVWVTDPKFQRILRFTVPQN